MLLFTTITFVATLAMPAQDHQGHAMDRANKGMGFDQAKTTHHFRLEHEGGTIEVVAKDQDDKATISQVRGHLKHVDQEFADGDFRLPMFVHDTDVPGTAVLKERRSSIVYSFEPLPKGAKVVIRTSDPQALAALHEFLRYQIREHKTGDPVTVRGVRL